MQVEHRRDMPQAPDWLSDCRLRSGIIASRPQHLNQDGADVLGVHRCQGVNVVGDQAPHQQQINRLSRQIRVESVTRR